MLSMRLSSLLLWLMKGRFLMFLLWLGVLLMNMMCVCGLLFVNISCVVVCLSV